MAERPVTGDDRVIDLIASFGALHEKDREAAAIAASSLGPPAIPALVDALRHCNPSVREQAALALGRMGPAASAIIPDLIASLDDESSSVRKKAAAALGAFGPAAKAAIPHLIRLLGKDFDGALEESALALAAIGPASVAPLIRLLGHRVGSTRGHAALALGKIGPAAAPAVPELIELIEDPYRFVWISSIESLGQVGPAAEAAIPALIGILASEDLKGRRVACQSLIFIGPAAVPAVLDSEAAGIEWKWELDGIPRVWSRNLSCGIIQAIGPAAVPDLVDALAGGEPASSRAWEALSTWNWEEVEPFLKDASLNPNMVTRTKAGLLLAMRQAADLVGSPLSELRNRFSQAHDVLLALLSTAKTAPRTKDDLRTFRMLVMLRSFRKVAIEETRLLGRNGDHSGPASRVGRLAEHLGGSLTRTVTDDGRKRLEFTDLGRALGEWIEANPHRLD